MAIKHFGLAFQISDDFLDIQQDTNSVVKGLTPNYVLNFGKERLQGIKRKYLSFSKDYDRIGIMDKIV